MSADDHELIERSRNGDYSAFEQLLLRYDRDVLSIAGRYTNDADDAKDIYQETFIRVYKGLSKFRGECSFPTWVYRITVNVCLSHRRRQHRRATVPLSEGENGSEPEGRDRADERAESSETLRRIAEAMEALSPQQRLAFSLKHYNERTIREIADVMECEEGTVKRYLFDATRRLRERLHDLAQ
ncbi:MAG: RNA polymerase sigma factor [Bacteroidetes bacterium]|nr:MAG: RNA polymerase sigma factor [Bacteroidota bacterium]